MNSRTCLYGFASGTALLGLLTTGGCSTAPSGSPGPQSAFASRLKPVLEYYCTECHNPKLAPVSGGLDLTTGRTAMTTGRHAPVILPGHPDQSLLVTVLRLGHEEALGMPPAPDKISDEELNGVKTWIRQGAQWPAGEQGRLRVPVDGTAADSR